MPLPPDAALRRLRTLGATLRAEANDLKRTADAVAREVEWPLDRVERVFAGAASPEDAEALARAFCAHYPVAARDVAVDVDESDAGVVVMAATASAATARVFDRPTAAGALVPYYEYRDTAMLRGAPFRPEWIRPLRVLPSAEPGSPEVAFNKGHLLHQFTFFIGDVTLYWETGSVRHARALRTGDSCYITPFVPHSFASRDAAAPGLIIAVTYGGALKHALPELAGVCPDALACLAGRAETAADAFVARLGRALASEMMTAGDLLDRARGLADAERCRAIGAAAFAHARADVLSDMPVKALADVLAGVRLPTARETVLLARTLNVPVAALQADALPSADAVVVRTGADAPCRPLCVAHRDALEHCVDQPSGTIVELVRTNRQPHLKAFVLTLVGEAAQYPSSHGLHEYVYNHGEEPATIVWSAADGSAREATLEAGGSAYIRPLVTHGFVGGAPGAEARLLVVRVPGFLTDAALDEYATAGPSRARALHETDRWF